MMMMYGLCVGYYPVHVAALVVVVAVDGMIDYYYYRYFYCYYGCYDDDYYYYSYEWCYIHARRHYCARLGFPRLLAPAAVVAAAV